MQSEKTAKRNRMLVTNEDGCTKVVRKRDVRRYCCSVCKHSNSTRWRFINDAVKCKQGIYIFKSEANNNLLGEKCIRSGY